MKQHVTCCIIFKLSDIPKPIWLFALVWFIANLLQAIFTQVIGDEGYYWFYSRYLQAGYYDHPPVIAFLIRISSILFYGSGNLAIRFGTVCCSTLLIPVLWKMIPLSYRDKGEAVKLFISLFLITPVLHIYGFITTPDAPLLLFTALYFWAFQRLLLHKNSWQAIFLGICAALILYAKYHGGIFILFSILVYPKILKDWRLYLAGLIGIVLLIPHIVWQINHDWISVHFHLIHRAGRDYRAWFPTNYLGGAIATLGPLGIITLAYFSIAKTSSKSPVILLHRIYLRLIWGILSFFLVCSFFMRIEAHWVAGVAIPLLLALFGYIINLKADWVTKRWWKAGILGILVLITAIRIFIILPVNFHSEFHDSRISKETFTEIRGKSDNHFVVFVDSYKKASLYWFYTGEAAYTHTDHYYRESQFELNKHFTLFHNKDVYLLSNWHSSDHYAEDTLNNGSVIFPVVYPNYQIVGDLNTDINHIASQLPDTLHKFETYSFSINLKNPNYHSLQIGNDQPLDLMLLFRREKDNIYIPVQYDSFKIGSEKSQRIEGTFRGNILPNGTFEMLVIVRQNELFPQEISWPVNVTVTE